MPPSRGVLKIRFNQDQGCFAVAKEGGAQVFNVEPLAEKTHLDYAICGGLGHVEMLERTNLVAVVGGGQSPKFPDRNGEFGVVLVGVWVQDDACRHRDALPR
eukprot:Em0003g1454a